MKPVTRVREQVKDHLRKRVARDAPGGSLAPALVQLWNRVEVPVWHQVRWRLMEQVAEEVVS